jgi:protein-S-isoprenylcysteine O-methyltransferase Ste14
LEKIIINRYQKLFGVGPIGLLISLVLFGLASVLDRALGQIRIFTSFQPGRIAGFVLIELWICWHVWAIKTISSWWKNGRLCTAGPFRFVRHPIYAGAIWLLGYGVALLFNSWIMLACPLLQYLIMSFLVRKEEKMMSGVFGEDYARYAARTGRLLPKIFG